MPSNVLVAKGGLLSKCKNAFARSLRSSAKADRRSKARLSLVVKPSSSRVLVPEILFNKKDLH